MHSKAGGRQHSCRTCSCQQCREHCAAWVGASSVTRAVWCVPVPRRWAVASRAVTLRKEQAGLAVPFPGAQRPSDGQPQQAAVPTAPFPRFPSSFITHLCQDPAAGARGAKVAAQGQTLPPPSSSRVTNARAQRRCGQPGVQQAPAAGLVCCSHRWLEHRVWVSKPCFGLSDPKTTSSGHATQPLRCQRKDTCCQQHPGWASANTAAAAAP